MKFANPGEILKYYTTEGLHEEIPDVIAVESDGIGIYGQESVIKDKVILVIKRNNEEKKIKIQFKDGDSATTI